MAAEQGRSCVTVVGAEGTPGIDQDGFTERNGNVAMNNADTRHQYGVGTRPAPFINYDVEQPSMLEHLQTYRHNINNQGVSSLQAPRQPTFDHDLNVQPTKTSCSSLKGIPLKVPTEIHKHELGPFMAEDLHEDPVSEGRYYKHSVWHPFPNHRRTVNDLEKQREAHASVLTQKNNIWNRDIIRPAFSPVGPSYKTPKRLVPKKQHIFMERGRSSRGKSRRRTPASIKRLIRSAACDLLAASQCFLVQRQARTTIKPSRAQSDLINEELLTGPAFAVDARRSSWEDVQDGLETMKEELNQINHTAVRTMHGMRDRFPGEMDMNFHRSEGNPELLSAAQISSRRFADAMGRGENSGRFSGTSSDDNDPSYERPRPLEQQGFRRRHSPVRTLPLRVRKVMQEQTTVFDPQKFDFDKDMIAVHQLDDGTLITIPEHPPSFDANRPFATPKQEGNSTIKVASGRDMIPEILSMTDPSLLPAPTTIKTRARQSQSFWDEHGIERTGHAIVLRQVYASEDLAFIAAAGSATTAAATTTGEAKGPAEGIEDRMKRSQSTSISISTTKPIQTCNRIPSPPSTPVRTHTNISMLTPPSTANTATTTETMTMTETAQPSQLRRTRRKRKRVVYTEPPTPSTPSILPSMTKVSPPTSKKRRIN